MGWERLAVEWELVAERGPVAEQGLLVVVEEELESVKRQGPQSPKKGLPEEQQRKTQQQEQPVQEREQPVQEREQPVQEREQPVQQQERRERRRHCRLHQPTN